MLRSEWVKPLMLNIAWDINNILSVADQREKRGLSYGLNVSKIWTKEVKEIIKEQEGYSQEEWWDYQEVRRRDITWDIKKIPELNFLLR